MDYKKHYFALCYSRQALSRCRTDNVYYELHHILPRSLGGTDVSTNLVLLTAREHYVAHLLLYFMYRAQGGTALRKMAFALISMLSTTNTTTKRFSSRSYSIFREAAIKNRLGYKVENTENYKKCKSNSHKQAIRVARLQAPARSAITKRKMSESALKRGDNFKDNHTTSICPYCNKTGQTAAMKRWHFTNCKHIEEVINA